MITIEELKKEIEEENKGVSSHCGLFAPHTISSSFPDVKVIKELYKSSNDYLTDIDLNFFRRYKNRFVLVDSYDEWIDEVVAMLRANIYKYNELYETMLVEYNKMENYDMTESGTDTTKKTGSVSSQSTDTIGSQTFNNTTGNTNETMTHKVNPFNDSNTSYVSDINETVGASRSDSSTSGTRSDSSSNTDTYNTTDTITHSFSRHGNIGVLSGQQLVEQSRKVALFNIWSVIFADTNNLLLGGFV